MSAFPRVDQRAPCVHGNPERFFDPTMAKEAKAECGPCPFRQACLDYALEWLVEGVWAGTDEAERARLRQRMGIVGRSLSAGTGQLPWGPQPHGSHARYRWDIRNGHRPCVVCREAEQRRQSPHNPSPWGRGRTTV